MAQLLMRLSLILAFFVISILGLMSGDALFNSGESNEDDQLKQALLIVNLLKSEYIKVLRENNELQKLKDSEEQDNSTCPTTVEDSPMATSTLQTTPSIILSDGQMESSPPSSLQNPVSLRSQTLVYPAHRRVMIPTNAKNYKQPHKYNGRRMMPKHTDNNENLRRLMIDDDPFGEHPEETAFATWTSTANTQQTANEDQGLNEMTTPSPSVTISHGATSSPLYSTPKDFQTEAFRPKKIERQRKMNDTAAELKHHTKFPATKPPTVESDSVMSQVASELINEMKGEKNEQVKHGFEKIQKTLERTETTHVLKSTVKVYLEGSSRFPVHLPENHAFCHTNPYSPLCRTFIG